jgi:hypothetical protein
MCIETIVRFRDLLNIPGGWLHGVVSICETEYQKYK